MSIDPFFVDVPRDVIRQSVILESYLFKSFQSCLLINYLLLRIGTSNITKLLRLKTEGDSHR